MKICSICGEKKDATLQYFVKCSRTKSGMAASCKVCNRKRGSKWHILNPEKSKRNRDKWALENKEHKAKMLAERHIKLRLDALLAYSMGKIQCACCGETRLEFMALDHINGGGRAHRAIFESSAQFYRNLKLAGYPTGLRVLCHNCNQARGLYKYCPHEKER